MSAKATRTAVPFSLSTAFGLESNRGRKPSCSSFCWATGWTRDPKPHSEDTEPLTAAAGTAKCHKRANLGVKLLPCVSKVGGKMSVDESGNCSHTQQEQRAATNTHQETGSNLSTVSSLNLGIC